LAYAIAWVQKLAHGHVAGQLHDVRPGVRPNKQVTTTAEFINARLGSSLTTKQISKLLINVEFTVVEDGKKMEITAPYWRTDIEIPEDIVEEVGRLHGYDKLPVELPSRIITPAKRNNLLATKGKIRSVLSAAGANEVLTYSFVHSKLLTAVGQDKELAFQLSNALSPDLQYYRLSLLPSLLDKVHSNIKAGHSEFALYEINKTHDKSNMHEDGLPIEEERVALVFAADSKASKNYHGSAYYQARAYATQLLKSFGINNPVFEPATTHQPKTDSGKQVFTPFEKGRTAYVKTHDGKLLGIVGEIKSAIKKNLKLPEFIAGFELDVQMLEQYAGAISYSKLSRFPSTQQDISLKVSQDVSYVEVANCIEATLKAARDKRGYNYILESIDIYQPEKTKTKNVAFRITLSHHERTLVTEEVNKLLDAVADTAKKMVKAERI
jgi:phenylalanyl-tRNA synthetase beta chain